jgi:hypothetical protein
VIGRGGDAVGCVHCTAMGGAVECRICGRVVCVACAADWTTCDQPSGRILRLGMTARLRDVDPQGRLGLVFRFPMRWRLVDLRALRWVAAPELPRRMPFAPRLTGNAHLVYPSFTYYAADGSSSGFRDLVRHSLTSGDSAASTARRPAHCVIVSRAGRWYGYASEHETVELYELGAPAADAAPVATIGLGEIAAGALGAPRSLTPFPGGVVQSVAVDDARDLVASGTWGKVALYGLGGGQPVHLGAADVDGDVRWIAVGGSTLAASVSEPGGHALVAWRIEDNLTVGPIVYRHASREPVRFASLSGDGAYLAVGRADASVVVHRIGAGTTAVFTEHTDAVSFVRFAGDDHLLITADDDNRVVLRPRTAAGYVPVVVPVDLPDAPVALP